MDFSFVTVYVSDMEASLSFYNGLLGLPVRAAIPYRTGEMAMLGRDGMPMIELISRANGDAVAYSGFSVGIAVGSLDEAVKKLASHGHDVIRGPFSPMPGVRFSFIHNPDGIEIELIEGAV
jgi:lactoylglutathione lyase